MEKVEQYIKEYTKETFGGQTMKEEQILKAFNNRWRIKGFDLTEVRQLSGVEVRNICLDFFRTAILIAAPTVPAGFASGAAPTAPTDTAPADDQSFTAWWNLYNKKIDRAKCERKWSKLTIAERKACIAATPAYVASTPDLQYRRHPATYLNNKSWENQIIPRNNAANTKPSLEQQRLSKLADIIAE